MERINPVILFNSYLFMTRELHPHDATILAFSKTIFDLLECKDTEAITQLDSVCHYLKRENYQEAYRFMVKARSIAQREVFGTAADVGGTNGGVKRSRLLKELDNFIASPYGETLTAKRRK